MARKRHIHAKEIVPDILRGMTDAQLMQKYKLSPKGLRSAFDKLVKYRLLTVQELCRQSVPKPGETIIIDDLGLLSRRYLTINVPIHFTRHPQVQGTLWYVTEKALAITDLDCEVGEFRSFTIPCRRYLDADEITFQAECIWTSLKEASQTRVTSFRIISISPEDLDLLRQLMQHLTLGRG